MLVDWFISKAGMLLAFFVLSGVMYGVYDAYDGHTAAMEAEMVAEGIAYQVAMVANSAPEYSAGRALSRKIYFPEEIHGLPYIVKIDERRHILSITLVGEEISEFALLPKAAVINDLGHSCLVKEGFNVEGETSVGIDLEGMNRSRGMVAIKGRGANYTFKISTM
jgi:hypothetical protein